MATAENRIVIVFAILLSIVSVILTRKHEKASDVCMVAAYCLIGLLCWLMWG